MYDANIMKKSSRFYLKYNPDNRWSFWTGKWWSLCSEISGQFTPKLGGQFDRLFHTVERYPDKDSYYCKTRWKPNQRERISCYTQKQYKQNESIYHYNKNGSIDKIVENFETFNTRQFHYANDELSKIVVTGKDNQKIDELLIKCISKDEKGTCLTQTRASAKSNKKEEIVINPKYD